MLSEEESRVEEEVGVCGVLASSEMDARELEVLLRRDFGGGSEEAEGCEGDVEGFGSDANSDDSTGSWRLSASTAGDEVVFEVRERVAEVEAEAWDAVEEAERRAERRGAFAGGCFSSIVSPSSDALNTAAAALAGRGGRGVGVMRASMNGHNFVRHA